MHGSRCPILHNTLWATHFVSCISVLHFVFILMCSIKLIKKKYNIIILTTPEPLSDDSNNPKLQNDQNDECIGD